MDMLGKTNGRGKIIAPESFHASCPLAVEAGAA
jgi:hypothetical protein